MSEQLTHITRHTHTSCITPRGDWSTLPVCVWGTSLSSWMNHMKEKQCTLISWKDEASKRRSSWRKCVYLSNVQIKCERPTFSEQSVSDVSNQLPTSQWIIDIMGQHAPAHARAHTQGTESCFSEPNRLMWLLLQTFRDFYCLINSISFTHVLRRVLAVVSSELFCVRQKMVNLGFKHQKNGLCSWTFFSGMC